MKKINSLLKATAFMVLLLTFNSCSKEHVKNPNEVPPPYYPKPSITWSINLDTTHRFLSSGFQVYPRESVTLSITAKDATTYKILESGTASVTPGEITNDLVYTAQADGKGGTTTSGYGLDLMTWNKTYLCQNSPKWAMSISKLAYTSDSLAEPTPAEWVDGILEQNAAYRYYPDQTGDVTVATGPTAGVHGLAGGYQLIYNDTHILFYGGVPEKIESINSSTMVLSQVQKILNSNPVKWAHYRWTYVRIP